ncbi:50S ribosomal protein L17 [Amnibacterium setariae]|uniref:Large ribosomal subunit protein bL17 n=1 Tax=Amnibacterium setariae TaxID=2306585 RepID=A0A3A1U0B4_9MICO|nr:50S ribosomal protein L17 [Amnibacterium setariae]RIX30354.1 50S ribosomal protein L17 [Amnibacterium setariae]
MPRPTKGPRLGGGPAHERMLLGQLASQLFEHRSIQTTEAKAKRLRPVAERLVTFAKRGDLHARRRVMRTIGDKTVVHELFTEIAPLVAERQGGYTRIVKTGFRKGDNAPMAVIELVLEPVAPKRSSRTRTAAATAPAASSDVPVEETNTVEESAPIEAESETPAATEVEESAAATGADAPEADAPAADEPATPDEKPATPAS